MLVLCNDSACCYGFLLGVASHADCVLPSRDLTGNSIEQPTKMLLPLSRMIDSGFLKSSRQYIHFGEPGCLFPVSTENIGSIVDLVSLKQEEVECREPIDNISKKVLGT